MNDWGYLWTLGGGGSDTMRVECGASVVNHVRDNMRKFEVS